VRRRWDGERVRVHAGGGVPERKELRDDLGRLRRRGVVRDGLQRAADVRRRRDG
jgi:hypothetical protein